MSKQSASTLRLTLLLCAVWPPPASVVVISMCTMATQRSMQAEITGTKVAGRYMGFDSVWLICCRGMLRVPDAGRSGAVHGVGAAGSGEEENVARGSSAQR